MRDLLRGFLILWCATLGLLDAQQQVAGQDSSPINQAGSEDAPAKAISAGQAAADAAAADEAVAEEGAAKGDEPVFGEADQKLESLLDASELFVRKSYNEAAQRWEFKIAWSEQGETSIMTVYLRSMGTRGDGSPILVAYGWTEAMSNGPEEPLQPEIIKLVAAINDGLATGNVSTAGNGVYVNTGIVMQNLTSDALWLHLWDMHHTRLEVLAEVQKIRGQ